MHPSPRGDRQPLSDHAGDGTHLSPGDPILELHFWNERLPTPRKKDAAIQWGLDFLRRLRSSLDLLAVYVNPTPRSGSVAAIHAEIGFLQASQPQELYRLAHHLGFELRTGEAPGFRFWKYAFWQNVFSWWLMTIFSWLTGFGVAVRVGTAVQEELLSLFSYGSGRPVSPG